MKTWALNTKIGNSTTKKRTAQNGFTLLEMAIVLVVLGLILGGILMPLSTQMEKQDRDETQRILEDIRDALIGFAMTNGRLPCPDTDGDGFNDGDEIWKGFSPLHKNKKINEVDTDKDGLPDGLELELKTSIKNADTDGDGFSDKKEIDNKYDPTSAEKKKLIPSIKVSTKTQRLYYLLNDVTIGEFIVSTGKRDSTPKGEFTIGKKIPRAWSRSAKLWMPYWMPFDRHILAFWQLILIRCNVLSIF